MNDKRELTHFLKGIRSKRVASHGQAETCLRALLNARNGFSPKICHIF
jgi:hypothetical protein